MCDFELEALYIFPPISCKHHICFTFRKVTRQIHHASSESITSMKPSIVTLSSCSDAQSLFGNQIKKRVGWGSDFWPWGSNQLLWRSFLSALLWITTCRQYLQEHSWRLRGQKRENLHKKDAAGGVCWLHGSRYQSLDDGAITEIVIIYAYHEKYSRIELNIVKLIWSFCFPITYWRCFL